MNLENRKKMILFEDNLVLVDTLVFLFESTFNVDVIRFSNYEDFYFYLKEKESFDDIVFVFLGLPKNNIDRQKIYGLFCFKKLNEIMPIFDYSDADYTIQTIGDCWPLKIPRKTSFYDVINIVGQNLTIDISIPKDDYTPISIKTFSFLDNMKHCVYLKLISGRYIKLFQPYDNITTEDVDKYEKKGVKFLFLRHDAYNWIFKQIENQQEQILNNIPVILLDNDDPLDEQMEAFSEENDFNFEDFVEKTNIKVDQSELATIPLKIDNYRNILKQNVSLKSIISKSIQEINESNFYDKRIMLLMKINYSIINLMGWTNETIIDRFIYASLLHDIALRNYPHLIILDAKKEINKDMTNLNEREKSIFFNHIYVAKELIERQKLPKDCLDLIMKHHEKNDGTGFPYKLDHKKINTMSVIFNLSLELANEILVNDNLLFVKDFVSSRKNNVRGGIIRKVLVNFDKLINEQIL